jgi:KDO2-lipid IV(A) lauroyltransferase
MRHRVEYWVVRALVGLVRLMPFPMVDFCGTCLGRAFYWFDRPHRKIAEKNVLEAFPSRSAAERQLIVQRAFVHFGQLLFALLKFSTLTPEKILDRVEFAGEEHVRLAQERGKGILFVTGHVGFWEIQALAHALKLRPMTVLARTLDNPQLNDLLERIRTRTGNGVVYRRRTIRRVMRLLAEGQGVGILIDQHTLGNDAIQVEFFGRPAATTPVVAALALRTGASVIPLFALPTGAGRYRLMYEHPVVPPPEDSEQRVQEFTQRCTDILEMYVRRNPELWLWMHRRWR